jgi:excisionase family DNA binding protein
VSLEHSPVRQRKGLPLLMRIADVAFQLGLSQRRIYQLIQDKRLELVKIGRASRVTSASVLLLASVPGNPEQLPAGRRGTQKAPASEEEEEAADVEEHRGPEAVRC